MKVWSYQKEPPLPSRSLNQKVDKLPNGPLFLHIMFMACHLINSLLLPSHAIPANPRQPPSTPVSFTRKKQPMVFSPRLSWSPDKSHDLLETSLLTSATPLRGTTSVSDPSDGPPKKVTVTPNKNFTCFY